MHPYAFRGHLNFDSSKFDDWPKGTAAVFTVRKLPDEFHVADSASKELIRQITSTIEPSRAAQTIRATQSWYDDASRRSFLYVLQDGMLSCSREGRDLFSFDVGDLVGVESVFCSAAVTLSTEFAVVVDEYPVDHFFSTIRTDERLSRLWNEYLGHQFKMFSIMLASMIQSEAPIVPEIRCFMAGDRIVEQGTVGDEVFTLLDGHARVMVDQCPVGEVLPEEIFGAIAALTGTKRTATVEASADCMVVVLSREQFKNMLHTRPETVLKLMEDMARVIVAMNEKVSALTCGSLS